MNCDVCYSNVVKKINLFDMKVFTSISCLHVSWKVEWIHNRDFALEYSTRIKPQKSKSAKLKTCVTLTKTLILEQKSNVIYVWQFETRNSNSIQSELDLAALPNSLQLKKILILDWLPCILKSAMCSKSKLMYSNMQYTTYNYIVTQ